MLAIGDEEVEVKGPVGACIWVAKVKPGKDEYNELSYS